MNGVLRIELLSDATFSSGAGTAGEVDVEIVHDRHGCPYIPARTVKGLLREAWLAMAEHFPEDAGPAREVLGFEADLAQASAGRLEIHDACLPEEFTGWIRHAVERKVNPVPPAEILRALTDVRRQTARDRSTGGPSQGALRSSRVALRGLVFEAPVRTADLTDDHWRVVSRLCLAVRHAGLGRNRGRGHVRLTLWLEGADVTAAKACLDA
jgi:RAMP superfamily protein